MKKEDFNAMIAELETALKVMKKNMLLLIQIQTNQHIH